MPFNSARLRARTKVTRRVLAKRVRAERQRAARAIDPALRRWSQNLTHASVLGLCALALAPHYGQRNAEATTTATSPRTPAPRMAAAAIVPPVKRVKPAEPVIAFESSDAQPDPAKSEVEPKTAAATDADAKSIVASRKVTLTTEPIRMAAAAKAPAPDTATPVARDAQHAIPILGTDKVWSEQQIADERAACAKLLDGLDMVVSEAEPVKSGACGTAAPVYVHRIGKDKLAIAPPMLLNCKAAAALGKWVTTKVQPAAEDAFGKTVARLNASSYSCRNRYGRSDAPLSEHALANAIDIHGFVLADGHAVAVSKAWGPVARDAARDTKPAPTQVAEAKPQAAASPTVTAKPLSKVGMSKLGAGSIALTDAKPAVGETNGATTKPVPKAETKALSIKPVDEAGMKFLRRIHGDACGIFGTVLGPEANNAHRDHLHLDMKPRRKAFCE